ncbi:MAG: hypothetical protein DWQ01_16735 [Planctomycetota bacterium]|nr:MAG: hypothetical protein DWQ01_16735 [Planctomycetota bacterium]
MKPPTLVGATPLPSVATLGRGFTLEQVQTAFVVTPEISPPESGLSLADFNQYAAAVERGFMAAGCKVVDRRRLGGRGTQMGGD